MTSQNPDTTFQTLFRSLLSFLSKSFHCKRQVMEGDYPPAPSTPPEPAPPDPRDPRSNTDRRLMLQQGLDSGAGFRRLMKASTMPAAGSHTSLEDMTCKILALANWHWNPKSSCQGRTDRVGLSAGCSAKGWQSDINKPD